jgi:hypothetical protein
LAAILVGSRDRRQAKIEKSGDEIYKKSSPLKLLSQSQPNFAEMIVGWYYTIFYENSKMGN